MISFSSRNVCTTSARFAALQKLREAGIPTVVWLSPILPFINDTEENILGILRYCAEAKVKGVICFGMGVTLREGPAVSRHEREVYPHLRSFL